MQCLPRIYLLFLTLLLPTVVLAVNPTFELKTINAPGVGGRIVTADFDSDGNADLAVGTNKGLTIFFGDGAGAFSRVDVGGDTGLLQVGDIDGDGRPDVIASVMSLSGAASINTFRNNGDRTFTKHNSGPIANWHSITFAAGDFDGDGKADVALSTSQLTVEVMVGNGDGTFQSPRTVYTATIPSEVIDPTVYGIETVQAAGDFDGNGKTDFMVSEAPTNQFGGANISFMLNQGGLTFTRQTFSQGEFFNATALDANGDGKMDVGFNWSACHTPCGGGEVWSLAGGSPQHIDTAFWDDSLGVIPNSPVAADFNGDGQTDIAWSYGTYAQFDSKPPRQSVVMHLGPAQLDPAQQQVIEYQVGADDGAADTMVTADFNNDGAPDIAVVSQNHGVIYLLLNTTVGVVKPEFRVSVSPASASVAAGQSASATATLTPTGGFTQTVTFTCSGLPVGATCAFTPASLVPSNGPAKTTISIGTTARTSSALHHSIGTPWFFAFIFPLFGIVCAAGEVQRKWSRLLVLAIICSVLVMTCVSCGGFSGSANTPPGPGPNPPGGGGTTTTGTPSGTYTVIVTAQGGGITHTANLKLTVQ